jgi:hypothetical protein
MAESRRGGRFSGLLTGFEGSRGAIRDLVDVSGVVSCTIVSSRWLVKTVDPTLPLLPNRV